MISQIIYTIIMALGVASGTKATSNTFYDEEKPTVKKAVVSNNYDLYYTQIDTYNSNQTYGEKYYLRNTQSITGNETSNLLLDPFLISNTAYTWSEATTSYTSRQSYAIQVLKFTNYTNSIQTIDINATLTYQNANSQFRFHRWVYETTDTNANTLIDKTLNTNTITQLLAEIEDLDKTTLVDQEWWVNANQSNSIEVASPQITLNENETKFIILRAHASKYNVDNYGWITYDAINISGQYIEKQITQEVVDIPGIMFTVLTMPFSFISTAFNLTIFPNTPYQLNFANLFMVILAVFVLMWIIKKVFH